MKIAQTNAFAKIAAVVAGMSLVLGLSFFAPVAKADTASDNAALIASLQAQLAALMAQMGGSSSASMTFTTDLTLGSSGASVTALQNWLIGKGFTIAAGATGYFGAQTKAALAAYQTSVGISPAAGYFGPVTRAKVNGTVGTTPTTPGTPTGLTGMGRLTNISSLGDVTSDLKEGDSATKVVGVGVDATDGDVAIQRLDVVLDIGSGGGSTNMDKYVSDVSVYLGDTKLGSMSSEAGDKTTGGVWTYRFSGLNGVVKKGMTGNIYVKVTPVSSIGADEDADSITATLAADSLRAVGADGISDTYITTAVNQSFTVSSATTGTLTVTAGADNPTASQIAVSSSTTTGKKLLDFNMKAKNSDITITDLAASFGTSDNNLSDVINTVYLMKGSTVVKSKTLSTGTYGVITFSDVNQTISKDATVNYTIVADFKGDAAYTDGTTVIASTTTSGWDVQDADGSSVTPSAPAVGNTQTLTATGITVVKGTPTATVAAGLTGAGDIATFALPFTVTAGDTDVFISGVATKGTSGSGIRYGTTTTSTTGATGEPVANLQAGSTVTGDSAGAYYKVLAGTSRTFTLNVALTATTTGATTAGYAGVILNSIAYGSASGSLTSYYTSNLDTFKSNDVYVTKR